MFLKKLLKLATGKYAFAISVGYKLVACAIFLLKAHSFSDTLTAINSCLLLIFVDCLWYGGIWIMRKVDFKGGLNISFC